MLIRVDMSISSFAVEERKRPFRNVYDTTFDVRLKDFALPILRRIGSLMVEVKFLESHQ